MTPTLVKKSWDQNISSSAKIKGLTCKECGRLYPAKAIHVCEFCFGPLEVTYEYSSIRGYLTRKKIEAGPKSMWRYWDLLPVETHDVVTLQEGYTPLLHARRLGHLLGLNHLYIKNDSVNPTFSFKDRVVSVAVTRAIELGYKTVACASTGNLAGAVSAYGAVAGLDRFIFIPSNLEEGKIIGAGVYDPHLISVQGNYDDVNRLCSEVADNYQWAFVNVNLRPYYAEGSKTLGFEVAEQLGWKAPDHVVIPAASGSLITKIYKGLQEFMNLDLIPRHSTVVHCAQALGCSPISKAIEEKSDIITPVKPNTIAKSLAIGNPADGHYAAEVIRLTRGQGLAVTDDEIIEGIKLLASTEGVFTETAGGVAVASLKKLADQRRIHPDDTTVVYITGNGLKTLESLKGHLEAPHLISPSLDEFGTVFSSIRKKTEGQKNAN